MFRIDRRNVKISEAPVSNVIEQKQNKSAAAPYHGEQPCFSAERQPEELLTTVNEGRKAAIEQSGAAQKLRAQAEALLEEAERQAEEIAARARAEADELVSAAKTVAEGTVAAARERADAEALEIRGQAWKSGFSEGREAAEKQAAEDGERLARDLRALIDGLNRGREDMVAHFEKDIISLSLAIAKKIVNVAIKKDDIMFESLIKNALNQMKREGKLSIRLSEEDCSRLFSDGSASFVLGGQTVTATAVSDPKLKPGDCILESDAEIVDAGVESQIRAVAIAFESAGGGDD